jgi:hypothetical protein
LPPLGGFINWIDHDLFVFIIVSASFDVKPNTVPSLFEILNERKFICPVSSIHLPIGLFFWSCKGKITVVVFTLSTLDVWSISKPMQENVQLTWGPGANGPPQQ